MTTHEFTREQLYDAVWAKPMIALAAEVGVTGTGLKKICDRLGVPTPERGYWAKLAHGKRVVRTSLGPAKAGMLKSVTIRGQTDLDLPSAVRQAKAATLDKARAIEDLGVAVASDHGQPALDEAEPAKQPDHPIATRIGKALARAKTDPWGFVSIKGNNLVSMTVGAASVDRVVSLVAKLLRGAEAMGWGVEPSADGLRLLVDGEPIRFRVIEKVDRVPHEPTVRELVEQERRAKRALPPLGPPLTDPTPSRKLSIEIDENPYGGLKARFSDLKSRPIELVLDEVLAGFSAHAALIQTNRRKAEEERRLREARELQQRKDEAFKEREARRMELLDVVHAELQEKAKLAAVLAHLAAAEGEPRSEVEAMKRWVSQRLERIEARVGPAFLDISIRHNEIEFREKPPGEGSGDRRYYFRKAELWLWSIDHEKELATAVSALQWEIERAAALAGQGGEAV